jgi:hypothetical protein
MTIQKKLFLFFMLALFASSPFFSASKTFRFGSNIITSIFDENLYPGDPVFLKLLVESPFIKNEINAHVEIIENKTGKRIRSAKMYNLEEGNINPTTKTLFVGLPLSTYLSPGSYTMQIDFQSNALNERLLIPFSLKEKTFVQETIPLDPVNTAIKTDDSPQRMAQIDNLNAVLNTINLEAKNTIEAFMQPVHSTRRTSFFGDRRTFAYSNGKSETNLHFGIDFGVPIGTEIFACASGKVLMSEMRNSTGWTIVIEHFPGLYSLYYHLDKMLVKKDDFVQKGDLIGLSGKTGLATGPHLHWEMRLLAEAVNPDYFVERFDLFK